MSRRKQNSIVIEEETDEEFMARITHPRIWTILKLDFIFQIITDDRIEEIVDMFKVILYIL